jgi:hypothetical protein
MQSIENAVLADNVVVQNDSDLGRMSAEAVQKQYDAAAEAFTRLGEDVRRTADQLQDALDECEADLKLLEEGAKAIMDKGKTHALRVQRASQKSQALRAGVTDLLKHIED